MPQIWKTYFYSMNVRIIEASSMLEKLEKGLKSPKGAFIALKIQIARWFANASKSTEILRRLKEDLDNFQ